MANSSAQEECYEYKNKTHSLVEASFGNKTKYEFGNKERRYLVSKLQVDGCLINNGEACDWLFELKKNVERDSSKAILIFVELKDSDLIKAVSQIEKSINDLCNSKDKFQIHARIVLTRTYSPDIRDNRVKKFVKTITAAGGTVEHRSQKYIEDKII